MGDEEDGHGTPRLPAVPADPGAGPNGREGACTVAPCPPAACRSVTTGCGSRRGAAIPPPRTSSRAVAARARSPWPGASSSWPAAGTGRRSPRPSPPPTRSPWLANGFVGARAPAPPLPCGRAGPRRPPGAGSTSAGAAGGTAPRSSPSTAPPSRRSGGSTRPGSTTPSAATPSARFRVATRGQGDGEVVGYAVTGRAGPRGYLQRLAVAPAAQRARDRRGAGRRRAALAAALGGARGPREHAGGQRRGRRPLRAPRLPAATTRASPSSNGPCRAPSGERPLPRPRRGARRRGAPRAAAADRPCRREGGRQEPSDLTITAQTTLVQVGGAFSASVLVDGVAGATGVRVTVHDRVRTRSELARAHEGTGLRASVGATTYPLGELALRPDGGRLLTFPLEADGRCHRHAGGVPRHRGGRGRRRRRARRARDRPRGATGRQRGHPAAGRRARGAGGHGPRPGPRGRRAATALAGALQAAPDVTATLAVGPALLDDLLASSEPDDVAAVEALRATAADHPVLALPYAPVSPDALADAGHRRRAAPPARPRARRCCEAGWASAPSQRTWLAAPGPRGRRPPPPERARASPSAVVPRRPGSSGVLDGGAVARPAVPAGPTARSATDAPPDRRTPSRRCIADARLADALHEDEVAGAGRGPLGGGAGDALVRAASGARERWSRPSTRASTAATIAARARGAPGHGALPSRWPSTPRSRPPTRWRTVAASSLRRSLTPDDDDTRLTGGRGGRRAGPARPTRASVQGMVGPDAPQLAALDRHLLRATGLGLSGRRAGSRRCRGPERPSTDVAGRSPPRSPSPSRSPPATGTVPLTIRNDTGRPVEVRLRFRSAQARAPRRRDAHASPSPTQTTRLDIDVRARTSGALPFDVEVTSPDGELDARLHQLLGPLDRRVRRGPRAVDRRRPLPHRLVGAPLAERREATKLVGEVAERPADTGSP